MIESKTGRLGSLRVSELPRKDPDGMATDSEPLHGVGFVALIDALGFKGIWGSPDAAAPIGALRSVKAALGQSVDLSKRMTEVLRERALEAKVSSLTAPMHFRAFAMSDTAAVVGFAEHDEKPQVRPFQDFMLLLHASLAVSHATAAAVNAATPLAYRGAIAWGEVWCDDNFVVGPAVDEAAALMEQAEVAAVWLAPSARELFATGLVKELRSRFYLSFAVPLKNGRTFETLAVNPHAHSEIPDLEERLRPRFKSAGKLDVAIKLDHTERFWTEARRHRDEWKRLAPPAKE